MRGGGRGWDGGGSGGGGGDGEMERVSKSMFASKQINRCGGKSSNHK